MMFGIIMNINVAKDVIITIAVITWYLGWLYMAVIMCFYTRRYLSYILSKCGDNQFYKKLFDHPLMVVYTKLSGIVLFLIWLLLTVDLLYNIAIR